MSGGTEVSATGMTSPFFNGGESRCAATARRTAHRSPRWLCTSAFRSDGMSMPEFSDSTASTPVSVSRTRFDPAHFGAPVGDVAGVVQPAGLRAVAPSPCTDRRRKHRGHLDVMPKHHGHRDQCDDREEGELELDLRGQSMSGPLVEVVGSDQRIARGLGSLRCTGWATGRSYGPTASPTGSDGTRNGCR